ncbi:MAG TPA: RNA-binding S4 domain-containing protein [candidate division Zixibacteria bacterium]|nr:RNA-binding S4 domain-containing protein [candidate division Zixibacteria bacterium]
MEIFEIEGDYIELFKLLKAEGLCESGADAKAVIEAGDVRVDGEVETRKRRKLFPGSVVGFAGVSIKIEKSVE